MTRYSNASARSPIFLHALFRTGSTWLFQAFRRLGPGYTCFQEPLHELTWYAREDRSILLDEQGNSKMALLRHPELRQPYFTELHAMPEECFHQLSKSDIYDSYFAEQAETAGLDFWRSLIEHAPARAVIQECRTAARIGLIRRELGGFHAYLWRNPHDQWWSYKVAPYFDVTTQLILNASPHPALIERLHHLIGFERFDHDALQVQFGHFDQSPLTPDNAYRAFYTLWLLGLDHAVKHADLLMNSDTLAASQSERARCIKAFQNIEVAGLELGDCRTPASRYTEAERRRLAALEQEVHTLWLDTGLSPERLEQLLALRREHDPDRYREESDDPALIVDLGRYRDLLWRGEARVSDLCRHHNNARLAFYQKEEQLNHEVARLRASLANAQDELVRESALKEQLSQRANEAEASVGRLEQSLHAIETSTSWRITAPLRQSVAGLRDVRRKIPLWIMAGRRRLPRRAMSRGAHFLWSVIRRHPRLHAAALALLNRVPSLQRFALDLLRPPVQQVSGTVVLNARSAEIYRQLIAAVETRRTGSVVDPSGSAAGGDVPASHDGNNVNQISNNERTVK